MKKLDALAKAGANRKEPAEELFAHAAQKNAEASKFAKAALGK